MQKQNQMKIMKMINYTTWVMLIVSLLFTVAVFGIMAIKSVYHLFVSLFTDELMDLLLYGVGACVISLILIAVIPDKTEDINNVHSIL